MPNPHKWHFYLHKLTTLSSLLITIDKKKIIKAIIMALIAARDAEVLWQNCLRKEIMWRKDYTAQARHREWKKRIARTQTRIQKHGRAMHAVFGFISTMLLRHTGLVHKVQKKIRMCKQSSFYFAICRIFLHGCDFFLKDCPQKNKTAVSIANTLLKGERKKSFGQPAVNEIIVPVRAKK